MKPTLWIEHLVEIGQREGSLTHPCDECQPRGATPLNSAACAKTRTPRCQPRRPWPYPIIRNSDHQLRVAVKIEKVLFRGIRAATLSWRRAVALPPLVEPADELTIDEVRRYSRHLIIPDVGMAGQKRLKNARVLVIGAGGLGSPALLYLAAAGVGTLGIVDFDTVDESNLQRQIIHGQSDIGKSKAQSAKESIAETNPFVNVVVHDVRLDNDNVMELFSQYDLIIDGTDNFATRYMVNDAAVLLGKPYVWGSIYRFDGQVSVFWAEHGPCYRCLYPEPPPPGMVPSCAEGGVLGVLCASDRRDRRSPRRSSCSPGSANR